MSQQINLILEDLKPRFDWLALPVVLAIAVAGLFVLLLAGLLGYWRADALATRDAALRGNLQTLQQQVKEMGLALSARQGDATLPERIEAARISADQRQEVLQEISHADRKSPALSEAMNGFSRQVMNGVWLTGFTLGGRNVEIRGRLLDAALLPEYITRLNGEAAFAGQRFEALEMKGEVPNRNEAAVTPDKQPVTVAAKPYTEFVLRSDATMGKDQERAR
jgi:hypothetical protein